MRSFYEGQTPKTRKNGAQWTGTAPIDPRPMVQIPPGTLEQAMAELNPMWNPRMAQMRQVAQESAMRYMANSAARNQMQMDETGVFRQRGRQYAPQQAAPQQVPVQTIVQPGMTIQDQQIMAQISQTNDLGMMQRNADMFRQAKSSFDDAQIMGMINQNNRIAQQMNGSNQMQDAQLMGMIHQSNAIGEQLRNRPMQSMSSAPEDMQIMSMINQSNQISAQMRSQQQPVGNPTDQDIMNQLAMVQGMSQQMGNRDYEMALQEQHRFSQMKPRPAGNVMAQQGVFQRPIY